jgi:hypothetical protein
MSISDADVGASTNGCRSRVNAAACGDAVGAGETCPERRVQHAEILFPWATAIASRTLNLAARPSPHPATDPPKVTPWDYPLQLVDGSAPRAAAAQLNRRYRSILTWLETRRLLPRAVHLTRGHPCWQARTPTRQRVSFCRCRSGSSPFGPGGAARAVHPRAA